MNVVYTYFVYFIIYAFLGWSMEVLCKLQEKKKFINRGFLVGPICPIYGFGVLGIVLLIGKTGSPDQDILTIFLKSIFVCSILEYLTSYFMEKLFNARWWDYSKNKFNINGRICANTMIPFGLLGIFVIKVLHPFVSKEVSKLDSKVLMYLAIGLFIIYLVDNIFSFVIMKNIKNKINDTEKDNTEAIKESINIWLDNNSYFYSRIRNAYPNFKIHLKSFTEKAISVGIQSKEMVFNNVSELKDNYIKNKKLLKEQYKNNKNKIKSKRG